MVSKGMLHGVKEARRGYLVMNWTMMHEYSSKIDRCDRETIKESMYSYYCSFMLQRREWPMI